MRGDPLSDPGLYMKAPFIQNVVYYDARIQGLVDERNAAKQARDFPRADAIRDALAAEGILLEDTPAGVRWRRG